MDKSTACFSATFSEDVANGKETLANHSSKGTYQEKYEIDDIGFSFVKKCIEVIESQGLEDEGLYRLVGVNSKVNKLTQIALDKQKIEKINLKDTNEWEIKTITSALKNYFRQSCIKLLSNQPKNIEVNVIKGKSRERLSESRDHENRSSAETKDHQPENN
ncbi:rho GTPase-activating protein 26-like [Centruroides sculpturatus]|uniref:rho GTPase-activating protein 26-like n=1 Tax=Centruroides sculpturatus TaxID=218467 RepID=UPI000C6E3F38|nr:rho GTPase-activating protein 26-like [Centruroides sculpturatus]